MKYTEMPTAVCTFHFEPFLWVSQNNCKYRLFLFDAPAQILPPLEVISSGGIVPLAVGEFDVSFAACVAKFELAKAASLLHVLNCIQVKSGCFSKDLSHIHGKSSNYFS